MPENVFVLGQEKKNAKDVETKHERDKASEDVSWSTETAIVSKIREELR